MTKILITIEVKLRNMLSKCKSNACNIYLFLRFLDVLNMQLIMSRVDEDTWRRYDDARKWPSMKPSVAMSKHLKGSRYERTTCSYGRL